MSMKKILLISLICALMTPLGYAQKRVPSHIQKTGISTLGKVTTGKIRIPFRVSIRQRLLKNPSKVKEILERRAAQSMQQAKIAREAVVNTFGFNTGLYETNILTAAQTAITPEFFQDLYPDIKPFITDPAQAAQYIISSNNRRVSVQEKKLAQARQRMEQALPQLQKAVRPAPQPAGQDISALVKQITPDTNYVLLGEFHHSQAIIGQMAQTLQALREQFPNREIILMTEALYEGTVFGPNDVVEIEPFLTSYLPLLETAQQLQIFIRGLEVTQLKNQPSFKYDNAIVTTFDVTTEALTLRNQRWREQIRQVREEHPQALIVVQSGMTHLDYTYPNSLGAALKKEEGNTFLAAFVPGYTTLNTFPGISSYLLLFPWMHNLSLKPGEFLPFSNFDLVSQGAFPQRIVQFRNDQGDNFSDITGFDVQIKVPAPADWTPAP